MAPFVPRERKHKKLARQQHTGNRSDTNAVELPVMPTEEDGRKSKREQVRAELQPATKMSSKKRKRLDKYIDTKLRRDENRELVKKLEASKVDTSLFRSSKTLSRTKESKRETFERALRERAAGISDGGDVLFERRRSPVLDEDSEAEPEYIEQSSSTTPASVHQGSSFGVGLKRPLETDEKGQPVLKKRKRKARAAPPLPKKVAEHSSDEQSSHSEAEDEDEWKGFSSEDTADEEDEAESNAPDSESNTSTDNEVETQTERVSIFKRWAESSRNAAVGFQPSTAITDVPSVQANFKPRPPSPDSAVPPLPSTTNLSRPAEAITIPRPEAIQAERLELPVVQEEQKILEAINSNPIVILCGATGSGKTTQVPQMLFENGYGSRSHGKHSAGGPRTQAQMQTYGMIGITQPRRVAATSVASRVAHEMGLQYRNRVAHQVRHDTTVSRNTAIKFMTDGILLREIQQDLSLSKYSVIVLDEVHERSVNTDILIGMLSRIVPMREKLSKQEPGEHYPLKLIIMSATLRINDFLDNTRLFKDMKPPIVQAEGRQHQVTVHFSRRTRREYLEETVEKVARGHRKLPHGGMLVFLTGQDEIETASRKLKVLLEGTPSHASSKRDDYDDDEMPVRSSDDFVEQDNIRDLESEGGWNGFDDDRNAEFAVEDQTTVSRPEQQLKPYILSLYAALDPSQQLRVFQAVPDGHRAIVLATNVAETSLTIPGIRYVFDCGRAKERRYDDSGVQTFEVDWISKASASQRSGRAGRTGPGHCYRLYSSAIYENEFQEYPVPEILRTPLESTVIQLKAMDIAKVANFPFPTQPDRSQLEQAEQLLITLGAISSKSGGVTELGRQLARFPVGPRYGMMLLHAEQAQIVELGIAVVAGLIAGDMFIPPPQAAHAVDRSNDDSSDSDRQAEIIIEKQEREAKSQRRGDHSRAQATLSRWGDQSDAMKILTAIAGHAEAISQDSRDGSVSRDFCTRYFLRQKTMREIQQLRQQLHTSISSPHTGTQPTSRIGPFSLVLPKPSNATTIQQINDLAALSFIDQIAIRADLLNDQNPNHRNPIRAIEVPYHPLTPVSNSTEDKIYLHPSSVLSKLSPREMPAYIIYTHLSRATSRTITSETSLAIPPKRTRMHALTTIASSKTLTRLAQRTSLLSFGKPIRSITQVDSRTRVCFVGTSLKEPGKVVVQEWPLEPLKVEQKRSASGVWEVVKVLSTIA